MLNLVADQPHFSLHPKCKDMKFNHLMFADDLILLYKANMQSTMAMASPRKILKKKYHIKGTRLLFLEWAKIVLLGLRNRYPVQI